MYLEKQKHVIIFYNNYSRYSGDIFKDKLCNDIDIWRAYSWNKNFLLIFCML